jgi:outer membrane lipoprotein SlyB
MQDRFNFAVLRSVALVLSLALALIALTLAGCAQQPSYQVVNAPVARTGTVESVRESVEQKSPSGLGLIAGGLIGGGLGSLVGGGTGRTVATVVGALGGGFVGNELERNQSQVVFEISVRYDDGTWATIRQNSPTGLRVGDRVVVTDNGIQLLGN